MLARSGVTNTGLCYCEVNRQVRAFIPHVWLLYTAYNFTLAYSLLSYSRLRADELECICFDFQLIDSYPICKYSQSYRKQAHQFLFSCCDFFENWIIQFFSVAKLTYLM